MEKDFLLERFEVRKLWGNTDYYIKIEDNILLLVAENGAGKTTILLLLFYFLSKQWSRLIDFDFELIAAKINGKDYELKKSEIHIDVSDSKIVELQNNNVSYKKFISEDFPKIVNDNPVSELRKVALNTAITEKYELPKGLFLELIDAISPRMERFDYDIPVIFFPTYRRQERTFEEIYGRVLIEDSSPDTIDTATIIREFKSMTEKVWLNEEDSKEIFEYGMGDIRFKLEKLIKNKKEDTLNKIENFVNISNKYFINKELIREEDSVKVLINDSKKLELDDKYALSSGEKQIVSMFFYINLSKTKPFIIIDEPEISVSVNNQERILGHIMLSAQGMIVATHSPIIVYRSDYENYKRDLDKDFKLE